MLQTGIITCNTLEKLIPNLTQCCTKVVSTCQVPEKIKNIVTTCFKGGSSAYLCLFGTLELSQNIIEKKAFKEEHDPTLSKIVNNSKTYFNLHGGLLLGSGLMGLVDALHEFGVINLNVIRNVMSTAANVLFLGANILSLKENIRLLQELRQLDCSKTYIDEEDRHWMKQSAFFGLVSNLGYIITTASLLYGGATAFTLISAVFACLCGGIKILYDLSVWAKEQGLF